MEISEKLQRFQCHKIVRAGKIVNIVSIDIASSNLAIETPMGIVHGLVSADWMARHKPEIGGYAVSYEDGYFSYSPAKAFEEGYKPFVPVGIGGVKTSGAKWPIPRLSHESQAMLWTNLHEKTLNPVVGPDPLTAAERILYDALTISLTQAVEAEIEENTTAKIKA